jgi:hypothetical protein
MAILLWMTRFFRPDELRALNAMRRRMRGAPAVTAPPETTEMMGEIVATDAPNERVPSGKPPGPAR